MSKTALQNKLTLNSYSANGKQTAERTSDFITFYAVLELFEACLRPIHITYSAMEIDDDIITLKTQRMLKIKRVNKFE